MVDISSGFACFRKSRADENLAVDGMIEAVYRSGLSDARGVNSGRARATGHLEPYRKMIIHWWRRPNNVISKCLWNLACVKVCAWYTVLSAYSCFLYFLHTGEDVALHR